jgi:hypothetical protein
MVLASVRLVSWGRHVRPECVPTVALVMVVAMELSESANATLATVELIARNQLVLVSQIHDSDFFYYCAIVWV